MVTAYVMVKANTGDADRLRAELGEIDGVDTVSIVAGDVDFIVKVVVDSPGAVKNVVASAVQGVEGVENTQTYIAME